MVKIAINGFGRIGRMVYRAALNQTDLEIVAVNDLTDAKTLGHLLKYDSVHGVLREEVKVEGNSLKAGAQESRVLKEASPEKLPWKDLGVEVVLESTGVFRKKEDAEKHLKAGAKKVVLSAPAKSPEIPFVVLGVNDEALEKEPEIVSMASCTTNCFAPVAKILEEEFKIVSGLMTTVHSYTNDQRILDLPHKDLRRARAAALSIIPTTTGAAKAVEKVIPSLEGKLNGLALRVPTPNGSITDFVCETEKKPGAEAVNNALKSASEGKLKGIMQYSEEPLVSVDIIGNPHSCIVDGLSTMVEGNLVKTLSWYDNEWAYSLRLTELMKKVSG